MIILGIFPCEVKDIILHEVRLNPREVRLKQTLENLENSEKPKFPFQVEGTFGGVPDMGMGFQTWGWDSRHGGWDSRHGDGIPDMGMGFQTWGWDSGHGMGYQTDDGVPVRGEITTFTSHQSGILHSLIFTIATRSNFFLSIKY